MICYIALHKIIMMTFYRRHKFACQSINLALIAFLAVILVAVTLGSAAAATTVDSKYRQAKAYHQKVATTKTLASERQNWLTAVRNFRSIYQQTQSHWLSPSCLFMMARVYHDMYTQFQNPLDLGEAIAYYDDVISQYSKNRLADDALFEIANIYLKEKRDERRAVKLFKRLIKRFPGGDMAPAAASSLKALVGTAKPSAPQILKASGVKTKVNGKQKEKKSTNSRATIKAELKPIRFWSNKNYTRVVIETTGQVKYKENLLKKTANTPRRLYVDLENCRIAPELQDPIPINDGLLKRVRSGQHSPTTARVVLDTQSLSDYKIFNLYNPFRIVIDVMGQKTEASQAAADSTRTGTRTAAITATREKTTVSPSSGVKSPKQKPPKTAAGRKLQADQPQTATIPEKPAAELPLRATAKIPVNAPDTGVMPSLAQQLGLGIKRIVLDPGHGGRDSGARGKNGLYEKDIVLKVAKQLAIRLKEKLDCEVIMTRDKDVFIPLEERTAIANTKEGDLFISIHVNAAPSKRVRGTETYILDLARNKSAMELAARENSSSTSQISDLQTILLDLIQNSKKSESIRLAEYVQDNMISGLKPSYKVKDLGVKQAPFIVLVGAQMPAILTELAFISNPTEANWLRSDRYLASVSDNLATGISNYVNELNLAYLNMR